MRLQIKEAWGAGGKRAKAVFNLSGMLNDSRLDKRIGTVHSSLQLGSDELPNIQAQEDEDCLLHIQRFFFKEFFGESGRPWLLYGYSLLGNSRSASAARVITSSQNGIKSVMVLEGTTVPPSSSAPSRHVTWVRDGADTTVITWPKSPGRATKSSVAWVAESVTVPASTCKEV